MVKKLRSEELIRKVSGSKQFRSFSADRAAVDLDAGTVDLSFSSEAEYTRYSWDVGEYVEVLDHSPESVRLADELPLCVEHDTSRQIGLCEQVRIDPDRKGRTKARFSDRQAARDELNDIAKGIRGKVSVGYIVHKMVLFEKRSDGPDVYRVTDWEPLEVSSVTLPADTTVGAGRSAEQKGSIVDETADPVVEITETIEPVPEVEVIAAAVEPVVVKSFEDGATMERKRAKEINEMAAVFAGRGIAVARDAASKFIESGGDPAEYQKEMMKMSETPVTATPDVGLSKKEVREYRLIRAINALANPNDRRAREEAAFEFEASDAMAKIVGREASGVFVPNEVYRRDLNVDSISAGGALVETSAAGQSMIDLLRNNLVIAQTGATILDGLVGDVSIPRQTGGATGYWVHDSNVTESQQTLGQIKLTPHTAGALTDIKRSLLKQASIGAENFVINDLATTLAHTIDDGTINGAGVAGALLGILNVTGIGYENITDNAPTYVQLGSLWAEVADANALRGNLSWVTNATLAAYMMTTETSTGSGKFLMEDNSIFGYNVHLSEYIPAGTILFGNWSDLVVAMWGTLDINVDTSTGSAAGTVRVVALQDCDVALRHVASMAYGS